MPRNKRGWGWPWIGLALSLALHVWDEAAHDFLSVYNPAVLAIREKLPFLPLPTFSFGTWLAGLIAAVLILLVFSKFAFEGRTWMRPLSYALAVFMTGNGIMHLLTSAYYGALMPGVYSSPVLIAASIWLAARVRRPGPRPNAAPAS